MNSFHYTIENLTSATGLTRKYIDRCFARVPHILDPHRRKQDGNKYWYAHGALDIFHKVANLKKQGRAISGVVEWLESEFGSSESRDEDGGEVRPNTLRSFEKVEQVPPQNGTQTDNLDLLIGSVKEAYETALDSFKTKVKLLEVGGERQREREETLRAENNALTQGVAREAQKSTTRHRLLDRLAKLNGWRKRKERGELIRQLQELEAGTPK